MLCCVVCMGWGGGGCIPDGTLPKSKKSLDSAARSWGGFLCCSAAKKSNKWVQLHNGLLSCTDQNLNNAFVGNLHFWLKIEKELCFLFVFFNKKREEMRGFVHPQTLEEGKTSLNVPSQRTPIFRLPNDWAQCDGSLCSSGATNWEWNWQYATTEWPQVKCLTCFCFGGELLCFKLSCARFVFVLFIPPLCFRAL